MFWIFNTIKYPNKNKKIFNTKNKIIFLFDKLENEISKIKIINKNIENSIIETFWLKKILLKLNASQDKITNQGEGLSILNFLNEIFMDNFLQI